mmetsp:Transcript_14267/g.33211  ORF Transcript_14267/g.33211 Transcript_14267/m.33211 type:complete len:191 (+) Transcript_14267:140-712(+)|eukprot:CAMPEP_0197190868 /NCGR_PEP_ID=MMETSP1423-20130617/22412_1 /TAXON_ID=476441 /ORGANISM="Pseudo-nitzschia heimii, Strain UNC1101" /LENGTH=190 /DNA_ID=CAMNT_0042643345 /DNA_START=102 /DNA_END=674 /DNA_ORIENTATION=+
MGCCNGRTEREIVPEDFEPSRGGIEGPRCVCVPYDDAGFITAQLLAIAAFVVSPVFWGAFAASVIGMILFQLPWCRREEAAAFYRAAVAAAVASLVAVGAGIYALAVFPTKTECGVFTFGTRGTNLRYNVDDCPEEVLAGIAFACAGLWCASAWLAVWFVRSGRHATWERRHRGGGGLYDGRVASVDMLV